MATKKLSRMNRFELLELMYELVKENENLRRKCEQLESRNNSGDRKDTEYSPAARGKPEPDHHRTGDDEHYRTRREEVMQRLMEQTYNPSPTPTPKAASAKKAPVAKKAVAPAKPVAQPEPQPEKASSTQPSSKPVPQARPQASKPAVPPNMEPQQQPRAKPAADDLDLDSILYEYLGDMASGRSGGSS